MGRLRSIKSSKYVAPTILDFGPIFSRIELVIFFFKLDIVTLKIATFVCRQLLYD